PAGTGAAWAMGSAGQAERDRRLFLRPLPWKGSGSWTRTPGNVRDQMSHPERIAAFALSLQVLADRIRMAIPSSVLCFAEVSMPRALGRRIELLVTTRKLFEIKGHTRNVSLRLRWPVTRSPMVCGGSNSLISSSSRYAADLDLSSRSCVIRAIRS